MTGDIPILGQRPSKPQQMVEVCRSYSGRLNLEQHLGQRYRYEHRDFFASRKTEAPADEAAFVSEDLYQECRAEVGKAMRECLAELREYEQRRASRGPQEMSA